MHRNLFLAALMASLVAAPWVDAQKDASRKEIVAYLDQFKAAFNRHDSKAVIACYAARADVRGVGGTMQADRKTIHKHYEEVFASNPKSKLELSLLSFHTPHRDVALVTTSWKLLGRADGTSLEGLSLRVLVKQDGKWKTTARRSMIAARDIPAIVTLPKGLRDPAAEKVMRPRLEEYAAAYDKGSIHTLGTFLAPDIEHVDIRGTVIKGQKSLEKQLENERSKGGRIRLALGSARFIQPDVLLADGTWEVTVGSTTTRGLFTNIAIRREGKWLAIRRQVMTPANLATDEKKR